MSTIFQPRASHTPYSTAKHAWSFVNFMYFLSTKAPGERLRLAASSRLRPSTLRQKIYGGRHYIACMAPELFQQQPQAEQKPDIPRLMMFANMANLTIITQLDTGTDMRMRDGFLTECAAMNEICATAAPYWHALRRTEAFVRSAERAAVYDFTTPLTDAQQTGLQKFISHMPLLAQGCMIGDTFIHLEKR